MGNGNSAQIISIIIPAFNEDQFIGKCLQSLKELNSGNMHYEVILIDNGSTDKTCEIAHSFLDKLDLRIVVKKDATIGTLRNLGVIYARGSVLAFLDADCTVSRDWLKAAVPYFNDPLIAAVGSSHITPEDASWVARTWDIVIGMKRAKGYTSKLPSGNLWVSRDKFLEIKGFNEELKTNEDFDLCYRLTQKGYKIFSDPAIKAWHWGVPGNLREFYKKNKWHGTHVFKVFLYNFPKFNNAKPLLFGFYYLVTIILLAPASFIFFSPFFSLILVVVTLSLPPAYLSAKMTLRGRKSILSCVKLFALYFTYGLARAHSILDAMFSFVKWPRGAKSFTK